MFLITRMLFHVSKNENKTFFIGAWLIYVLFSFFRAIEEDSGNSKYALFSFFHVLFFMHIGGYHIRLKHLFRVEAH